MLGIGQQLKTRRESQLRTITETAASAGITVASAHGVENGAGTWSTMTSYAVALGTRVSVHLRASTRDVNGIATRAGVSENTARKILSYFHRQEADADFLVVSAENVLFAAGATVKLS